MDVGMLLGKGRLVLEVDLSPHTLLAASGSVDFENKTIVSDEEPILS